MTRTQWFGVLVSALALARVFSGIWMHTHPTIDDPSKARRGWKAVKLLPLLFIFGDGWPNRGSPGRVPSVIYHWFVTAVIAGAAAFMLANEPY